MAIVAKNKDLQIEKLTLTEYETNTYIVTCLKTNESVLIDTPGEAPVVIKALQGTQPKYILLTHNHMDHIGAYTELREALKVPLCAHSADNRNLPSPPDVLVKDGQILHFGNFDITVIHTPGHTPGSLCFRTGKYLLSGDTIFPGGPGKTGSPADLQQIILSLTSKIFTLDDATQVYPGHGDPTVLKKEKEEFAVFSSRPHNPDLCGDVLWLSS